MDAKRPNSNGFHESDYHTPSPRNKRSNKLLERKASACMCTTISVVLVVAVFLGVSIGLRVTGTRNSVDFKETLGDTRLIRFDPYYCEGMHLDSPKANATMYLLDQKPPLSGWSNITIDGSFVIDDVDTYFEYYGWYGYGDYVEEDIQFVAWQFHLNSGSTFKLETCIDTSYADSYFYLVKGKSNYAYWASSLQDNTLISTIPACSESPLLVNQPITASDEYYFIFYAPDQLTVSPRVNLTLSLYRTEYTVDSKQASSCTTTTNTGSCSLAVPLGSHKYALLQTTNKETKSIKYGSKVSLTWICQSRDWIYVVIFFCPVIFFVLLFTAMYCVFVFFSSRKLRSYETLGNINSERNGNRLFKIGYRPKKPAQLI